MQEIVAETSAALLCRLTDRDPQQYIGNSCQYVYKYAKEASLTVGQACLQVIGDVEKVPNGGRRRNIMGYFQKILFVCNK
ncbi:MAG: hypothetical protein HQK89_07505 [Nitrospirae bacterium]|nr:hypothetical protein [Nitrospirota bacterium]